MLLVVIMLSLAGRRQCFILPIQLVINKEKNPLDSAFRGLAGPKEMKTEKFINVGFPVVRDSRQAYASLILRG